MPHIRCNCGILCRATSRWVASMVSVVPGRLKSSFPYILMKRFASGTRRRAGNRFSQGTPSWYYIRGKKIVRYECRMNLTSVRCMILYAIRQIWRSRHCACRRIWRILYGIHMRHAMWRVSVLPWQVSGNRAVWDGSRGVRSFL